MKFNYNLHLFIVPGILKGRTIAPDITSTYM